MKSKLTICFFVLGGFLFPLPKANAALIITNPTVNLGKIFGGPIIRHEFQLRNDGLFNLEILEIRPGCGCVVSGLKKLSLPPGSSNKIPVEIRTLGQPQGPHRWTVQIQYLFQGNKLEKTLEILAELKNEITVVPANLNFSIKGGWDQTFHLVDFRKQSIKIKSIECSLPKIQFATGKKNDRPDATEIPIQMTIPPTLPDGRLEGIITLFTSDEKYPDLQIPISINKGTNPRILIRPEKVTLVLAKGQSKASRLILFRDSLGAEVKLESLSIHGKALQARWASGGENGSTLRVECHRSKMESSMQQCWIDLVISHPVSMRHSIPIQCILE